MKIAFTGTHGTGKTTLTHDLVAALKKKGYDVGLVSPVARNCPFPINENSTEESQLWISLAMINKELETKKQYKYIMCNRSILDVYAYTFNIIGHNNFFKNLFEYWIKTYDMLVYVPIRFELKRDLARSDNVEFQKRIDTIIKKILDENNIKFYELPEKDSLDFIVALFESKLM